MAENPAVRKFHSELVTYQKAVRAENTAKGTVKTDLAKEKAALQQIDARKKQLMHELESANPPLSADKQKQLLEQLFALGESRTRTVDRFKNLLAVAKRAVKKDANVVKTDRSRALADLKPAEYRMTLKQTNSARKALGLKPVKTAIRPPGARALVYTVKAGDTLGGIATRFHLSLHALERANPQIRNPNAISVGERIRIPGRSTHGPAPRGKGNAAAVARRFLGWTEYKLQPSGKLDMDQWVPKDIDCANFVSGCLEKAGLIRRSQRSDGVVQLAANLRAAGWHDVSLRNAKPGDVVCFDGPDGNYQHVEIFDHWDGNTPVFIGSNNVLADGTQKITYDHGGTWAYRFHVIAPPR